MYLRHNLMLSLWIKNSWLLEHQHSDPIINNARASTGINGCDKYEQGICNIVGCEDFRPQTPVCSHKISKRRTDTQMVQDTTIYPPAKWAQTKNHLIQWSEQYVQIISCVLRKMTLLHFKIHLFTTSDLVLMYNNSVFDNLSENFVMASKLVDKMLPPEKKVNKFNMHGFGSHVIASHLFLWRNY